MSDTREPICLVIGASHAGCQLAESVRKNGWSGSIQVIGEEPYLPYHRPPLSKDFLSGKKDVEDMLIKPASLYQKNGIDFILNTRAEEINRERKEVRLQGGSTLRYDKLALATGSRPRTIPVPGADKEGVHYLRTIDDIKAIQRYVDPGSRAVIVGGGYIGLETAAALRGLAVEVTILEMMPRILQRVTAPILSDFYARVHEEEGVAIVTNAAIDTIEGGASVSQVLCEDGRAYPADLVIIGAGIVPNTEIAQVAGLEVEGGIVVDSRAATSDPDIFAAGDCTWHYNTRYNRWLRLESVQNAFDQARVAGANICGVEQHYSELPWFWSDQYDMKLQIAGLSQGFDDVVIRGSTVEDRQFAAFYFAGDRLLAVDAVNMPLAFMIGKKLLAAGNTCPKQHVSDPDFDLKQLLS